jgi:hypothetical protein
LTSPWSRLELTTSVVIGTDCIGSCKSNYHTITVTKAPVSFWDFAVGFWKSSDSLVFFLRCTTLCDKVYQWSATCRWFLHVLRFPPTMNLTATI